MDTFQSIYNIMSYAKTDFHKIKYKKSFRKKFFNYSPHNIKDKFNNIRYIVNNSSIQSINKKKCILEIFTLSQKYYYIFSRFAYNYKYKKAKKYFNNYDLNLTPFNDLSSKILINIYDIKSNFIYKFRISDLITIINNSLAHMDNYKFYAKPIKNPYTNITFNISTLYNIYFSISKSSYIMPKLFHLYFLSNFNIYKYSIYNNTILRQYAIKQHVLNASTSTKYDIIIDMLYFFRKEVFSMVDHNIDKTSLVNIFKPYIYPYLLYKYSNNKYICYYTRHKLFKMFIKFSADNKYSNIKLICNKNIMKKPLVVLEYYNYSSITDSYLYTLDINRTYTHGPENVGSENVGSENIGSENVGSENIGSENVGSENIGSENIGSENVGSENVGSENIGSENIGSENIGSENANIYTLIKTKIKMLTYIVYVLNSFIIYYLYKNY